MVVPDEMVYGFGTTLIAILGWIGKSLAAAAKELKLVSLIIRTCPGCKDTVSRIDDAQEHSEF